MPGNNKMFGCNVTDQSACLPGRVLSRDGRTCKNEEFDMIWLITGGCGFVGTNLADALLG